MINREGKDFEIDILSSVEFDLSEAIKDLIWNIKTIKNDVELIKDYLNFKN